MSRIGDTARGIVDMMLDTIPPKLRNVEAVRQRVVRGQASELARLRTYISAIDGNQFAVDQLRGEVGDALLADVTELILTHLGHTTEITRMQDGTGRVTSQARKAARGNL